MKNNHVTKFLFLISIVLSGTILANAQMPSLANVGEDVYTSEEDGFEIALPDGCMKATPGADGRAYRCDLKEGRITINVSEGDPPAKTDRDVANFVAGFKSSFEKDGSFKILSESPAKIGEYRGASFVMTSNGEKWLVIGVVWERFALTIIGRANPNVAGSDRLIAEAVSSFAFVNK